MSAERGDWEIETWAAIGVTLTVAIFAVLFVVLFG